MSVRMPLQQTSGTARINGGGSGYYQFYVEDFCKLYRSHREDLLHQGSAKDFCQKYIGNNNGASPPKDGSAGLLTVKILAIVYRMLP
ncbi:polysaccharide lyase family 3 protein [Moniliophthora roreri]|nr:polysaccharide lyase family 3 protein [Moniliophthora roreri]